jgi:hypothetical protein
MKATTNIKNVIKTTVSDYLNEEVNNRLILHKTADILSERMHCDRSGSCVHFAEEFVLEIHKIDPNLLKTFYVVEGYVDWQHGDGIPQQHTWIELKDGTKIDPTFEQFTKYGWANYSNKKSKKYTGQNYYTETIKGTWFSNRRKETPEQFFK